jgi:hypothetical protein
MVLAISNAALVRRNRIAAENLKIQKPQTPISAHTCVCVLTLILNIGNMHIQRGYTLFLVLVLANPHKPTTSVLVPRGEFPAKNKDFHTFYYMYF